MAESSSALTQQIARARRRLVLGLLLAALAWAWAIALVLAVGWFVAQPYVWASAPPWARWAVVGGLLGIATLTALAAALRRAPSPVDVALSLDERFGLKERVTTSLMLAPEQAVTSAGQALLADAHARLAPLRLADRFPVRVPWRPAALVPVGVLALVLLGLLWQPTGPPSEANAQDDAKLSPEAKAELAKKFQQIAKRPAQKPTDRPPSSKVRRIQSGVEEVVAAPRDTTDDLREGLKKATKLDDDIRKEIKAEADRIDAFKEQVKQIDRLRKKQVQKDGPAKDLVKAFREGDFKAAQEAAERLSRQLEKEEKDRLKKKVKKDEDRKAAEEKLNKLEEEKKKDEDKADRLKKKLKNKDEKLDDEQRKEAEGELERLSREKEKREKEQDRLKKKLEKKEDQLDREQEAASKKEKEELKKQLDDLQDTAERLSRKKEEQEKELKEKQDEIEKKEKEAESNTEKAQKEREQLQREQDQLKKNEEKLDDEKKALKEKELKEKQDEIEKKEKEAKINKEETQKEREELQREQDELKKNGDKLDGDKKALKGAADALKESKELMKEGKDGEAAKKLAEAGKKLGEMDRSDEQRQLQQEAARVRELRRALARAASNQGGIGAGRRPEGKDGPTGSEDKWAGGELDKGKLDVVGTGGFDGGFKLDGPRKHGEMKGEIQKAAQEAPAALDRQRLPPSARAMTRGFYDAFREEAGKKK